MGDPGVKLPTLADAVDVVAETAALTDDEIELLAEQAAESKRLQLVQRRAMARLQVKKREQAAADAAKGD